MVADHSSILVTGAAGFIGSNVCEALLHRGTPVIGLDNFDPFYEEALKRANLAAIEKTATRLGCSFRLVEGDICDADLVGGLLSANGVSAILHLAAKAGVRPSLDNPLAYERANVEGTINLLECGRRAQIGRFIFASSSSVYGGSLHELLDEDLPVTQPISPYAASKVAAECYCHAFHRLYDLPIVCLRLFTVYGPRQRPDLAINKFAQLISTGQALPKYGDGTSRRDYTFVGDIVRGLLAALDADLSWEIINLGSGNPFTLNELIATLEELLGQPALIEQLPPQPGDVLQTHANITKAKRLLDWEPQTTLREGIQAFLEWRRSL